MLVFLCVIALCSLLTPCQGSELAQFYLCKGTLTQKITDTLDQISLKSLLQTCIGGGKPNGDGGLLSILRVSDVVQSLGNAVGVEINEANLLKVNLNMKNDKFRIELDFEIHIVIECPITDLLKGVQLPMSNSASGRTKLIVKLSNNIPLKVAVTKDSKLEISMDEQNCKLLKVNIVLKSGVLSNGPLAILEDLTGTLTKILGNTVGGLLNNAVCKSVLPTVFNLLNQNLNLLCGTFPLGPLEQSLTYAINAVKGFVGDCLVIDVNVFSDGKRLGGQITPRSVPYPKPDCDGAMLTKQLLDLSIEMQMPLNRLNSILHQGGPITMTSEEVLKLLPKSVLNEGIIMTVTVISQLETILEEGATPKFQTSARVTAAGSETSAPVFNVTMDVVFNAAITFEDQCIKFKTEGLYFFQFTSGNTYEESALKSVLTKAANKLAASINGLQLRCPAPVTGMDIKNTTMQVKQNAITFVSVDNKK